MSDAPTQIGSYTILDPLGSGGMSHIFRARDTRLGREVAIKILSDRLNQEPEAIERFLRESRAASALNHPNIITIYEAGEIAGRQIIAMELVKGQTLRTFLLERQRPLDALPDITIQISRALAAAHDAGIVHRDIKPENIMVRDDGYVKVVDFGIARLLPTSVDAASLAGSATRAGMVVGTPQYMSPEQVLGDPVTTATDIFSLGVLLYEWVTGRHPFVGDTPLHMMHLIASEQALPPARINPLVSDVIDSLVVEMLDKDPLRRPSARDVARRLSETSTPSHGVARSVVRQRDDRPIVGRERERAELIAILRDVSRDDANGVLVGVAGEVGIGKSTIVEEVLRELPAMGARWFIARGRCSERLAGTEAYLPFLEALESLARGATRETAARLMKTLAPSWYLQLGVLTPATGSLHDKKAQSQERLKRELMALLEELSVIRPLVLFLEDIHWADASTLDLLAYVMTHSDRHRVAVVTTYRPSELEGVGHPFLGLRRELEGRGRAREIALEFLAREHVEQYLRLVFPGQLFPAQLAAVIHDKTEGNPLFMVDLVRELRDREVVVRQGDGWVLARAVPDFEQELPASIRSMVQRKIDGLSEADRRILVGASVQGVRFDTAIVARVLGEDAAEVEQRLDVLERRHAFVRHVGEEPLPDGTPSSQYRFVHALYQNGLYGSLRAVRRASLSGTMAKTLHTAHQRDPAGIASELALLFETARDFPRAAQQFLAAARKAASVFADKEAIVLARRGMDMIAKASDRSALGHTELQLCHALGLSLTRMKGYSLPEVEHAYTRARELCEQLGDPALLCPVLQGLWRFYCVKGDLRRGSELAEQLLRLAPQTGDDQLVAVAHLTFGTPFLHRGQFATAQQHMEHAIALYDPAAYKRLTTLTGTDLKCAALSWSALALWLLGYAERSMAAHREALAHMDQLKDPFTESYVLSLGAWLYQYRREPERAFEYADRLLTLASQRQFGQWVPLGYSIRGWAQAELGRVEQGIADARKGLSIFKAISAELNVPHFSAMLVEALGRVQQWSEALTVADDALALSARNDDRCWEPELQRLKGVLLLSVDQDAEAERCLESAITRAREMGARLLELRATVSWSLMQGHRKKKSARAALAKIYGWFTEGFDTVDLRDARRVLDDLSSTSRAARAPSGRR